MQISSIVNSKLVFSKPYLKSTLSTNLPHHKCAHWNNHRMWMPRECQCNQDKLVKESSKTTWQHSSSLHEAYLNIPSAFLHHGKSFDTSSCSATRCGYRWAPTPPPPTTQDLSTWTKPSGSWLQLEAFITAAHQPPEREVAHVFQHVTSSCCHPQCTGIQLPPPSSALQRHQTWVIRADWTQEACKKGWKLYKGVYRESA